MKRIILFLTTISQFLLAQFGQNKVQYKEFDWHFIQTKHCDLYFYQGGDRIIEFAAKAAEDALASIMKSYNYQITNRVTIIVYNSSNDFQQTNVIDEFLTEGIEGFTEIFKNRVVVRFEGSYDKFRHLIHHELVHAVNNDMLYGGSLQNIISKNITINLPIWFHEGMSEYQSLEWDYHSDMYIRDAIISNTLPDVERLNGYFAYRGGQAVFYYIAERYGREKISEIISAIRRYGNIEDAFKSSLGLTIKEFNERWKRHLKKEYWPDVSKRDDPDDYAIRLTDHRKDGGFYNTSPALSPDGKKLAFISNRDIYFGVYLYDIEKKKIDKRLVLSSTTNDFEELNVVTPGLSFSPDGKFIALSSKRSGFDVIYIIDIKNGNSQLLPIKLEGIGSVSWSPKGDKIAFMGNTSRHSDIWIYDLNSKESINLTDDIFTDSDPSWAFDGENIIFASDRGEYYTKKIDDNFDIYKHYYQQTDLYVINVKTKKIIRITDTPEINESFPLFSSDNQKILYISDANGIYNIYSRKINLEADDSTNILETSIPITNSLTGIYQISLSYDGNKLAFSTLNQSAYNLYLLNDPFEPKTKLKELEKTNFALRQSLIKKRIQTDSREQALRETAKLSNEKFLYNIDSLSRANYNDSTITDIELFSGIYVDKDPNSKKDTTGFRPQGRIIFAPGENYNFSQNKSSDKFNLQNTLDSEGNYVVNKYKISFSPDLIYANAGYSALYGLTGSTLLYFSDLMGDYRIIGITGLQIDLKNSDYGVAFYYLPKRIDYGIEFFHTARFVLLTKGTDFYYLYRFRNLGGIFSASYPFDKFHRLDFSFSYQNVSSENLDDIFEPAETVSFSIPSLSFVRDNTLWGYTSPIQGERYNITLFGQPEILNKEKSFYSVLIDYRKYYRFWFDYSFALRFSGGYSGGDNPQRFMLGGIENWINRQFSTGEIPLNNASDFAFLTPALPMRGYNYAEQIGTKYALANFEFRFPLIRYLITGGLPLFLQNIIGNYFIDVGSAWNDNKKLQLFKKDRFKGTETKDLLIGTGYGARLFLFYFLLRFDVAWAYDLNNFSKPRFYFSLGADF